MKIFVTQSRMNNVFMVELFLMGKALDGATNCLRDKLQNKGSK